MYSTKDVCELLAGMMLQNAPKEEIKGVVDYSMAVIEAEKSTQKASVLESTLGITSLMNYYVKEKREA